MPAAPTASVVVPNWNGERYLKMVLPSLKQQRYRNFETIVVDNGSEDGSVDYVRKHHPEVDLIALAENHGFAGGCNRGMGAAKGEFVALINNDLRLDPAWLTEMVASLRTHPEAGSAAGKMLQYDRPDLIDEAGGGATWHGVFYSRGRNERDRGQYDQPGEVLYASGGAVVYRRQMLRTVGLFDEDFFAYLEDVDLGLRSQLAGWTCRYVPTAVVYHMGGATSKRLSGFAQTLWARNLNFVILKNYPAGALARYAPKLAYGWAKTLLGAVKDGWLGSYVKAQVGFWRKMPRMLGKRRRIQRGRKVGVRYLDTLISRKFWAVRGKEK